MSRSIRIPVQKLLLCAQKVVGVIENQQTIPILNHVLIDINNQMLTLTATDSEIELRATESLDEVDEELHITVLGKKLLDICKYVPSDADVIMTMHEDSVLLKINESKFKLALLPVAEFPRFSDISEDLSMTISELKLLSVLKKTAFAMAHTDVRYYLNGLLFELNGGSIVAVATDGHRLAVNSVNAELNFAHNMQSIIPRKAVMEIVRMLDPVETMINVVISAQDIHNNNAMIAEFIWIIFVLTNAATHCGN